MKIAITGGAGYVGSALVPSLLEKGHQVTVLDTFWFGNHLANHFNLQRRVGDIRSSTDLREAFKGQDAVIHLACVSNDPSFDMNPKLGKEINYLCFRNILDIVKECNVPKFIYASSSSVYGVSDIPEVTEDTKKKPLTDYSKFKLVCEEDLERHGTGGSWTILRPATVCGYSARMRLDLVVNKLSIDAIIDKRITIFGRDQKRPNINIKDMVQAYEWVLEQDDSVVNEQIFNVGFENLKLHQIATLVKMTLLSKGIEILERPNHDPRSYHISSDKILNSGFKPQHTIEDAILSIKANRRKLINPLENAEFYNIKKMKELGI